MPKRLLMKFLAVAMVLLAVAQSVFAADLPLPASSWYAVTWEEATDTLHWINASGEQASIARPKLEGQISQAQTRLHISPNGRTLVVISPLLNGREGIGFYDFQSGQFFQYHESQPNEVFLPAGNQPFTETSSHFAIPLRNQSTGDWRMIVFDTAGGNAVDVLTRTDANMPPGFNTDTNWWPQVASFNLDEALNTLEVRFQFVTQTIQMPLMMQAFNWRIPPVANTDTVTPYTFGWSPLAGYDVHPQTGEIVFALWDAQNAPAPSTSAANRIHYQASADSIVENVAAEMAGSATLPRWLHNGDWVAYYRNNGALALHWLVMTRDGQTNLPLSPDIISVYHTPDGFLSKSTSAWRLDHATTLALEGFSEPAGNTIYQPGTSFAVVYTTPANTPFTLPSVAEPVAPLPQGPGDIQAPPTALPTNPPPQGPGDLQLPPTVAPTQPPLPQGPGDFQAPPTAMPTTPPLVFAPVPSATPTPGLNIVAVPVCNGSPATRLQNATSARTVQPDGTLALRGNLTDDFPSHQVPAGLNVSLVGGPQCRDNLRMWQIQVTLNGQSVTGWVAEGSGQTYYLAPPLGITNG